MKLHPMAKRGGEGWGELGKIMADSGVKRGKVV
jgi:hypothetical protein